MKGTNSFQKSSSLPSRVGGSRNLDYYRRMLLKKAVFLIIVFQIFALVATAQVATADAKKPRWFKGNTHTHTLNSDGDSTPDDVIKWYRGRGYNFLFLTDHEYINNVQFLNDLYGRGDQFIVLSGQEVTDSFGGKPYHSNGLGISKVVMPNKLPGAVETLQKNINDIVGGGGIAQVNHPNFGWALTAEQLIGLKNYTLLEIYNGHPLVNNQGSLGFPSAEEMWDKVLSTGKILYAVADDDSHHFKRIGDPTAAQPGQGWIHVRATELTSKAIIDGLKNGDFYASNGVELRDYEANSKKITVTINQLANSKYRTAFIGMDGKVLSETATNPAVYEIKGNEGYVRAKIFESNGKNAWTQPYFISAK